MKNIYETTLRLRALERELNIESEKPDPLKLFCVVCGKDFIDETGFEITCSKNCQSIYYDKSRAVRSHYFDNSLRPDIVKALGYDSYDDYLMAKSEEIEGDIKKDEIENSGESIYFIRNTDTDRIKIGYSKNVGIRLKTLQTSSPSRLELLAMIPGNFGVERELHNQFGASRLNGEWFERTKELDDYISSIRQ